jgi:hypothetical protein
VGYTLADLELSLAERRLALQTAALGVREQRGELRVEVERSGEGAAINQREARLWWRYY